MADWSSVQPRVETQAASFADEHADGRGILVAILDTGVDPGAAGLQVTTDGQPKIVNIIDCTGSGDVDTSTVVEATTADDGTKTITGLTGRTISLNPAWVNPENKWRVGVKRGYELYPNPLVNRMKKERKKVWDAKQHEIEVALKKAEADAKDSKAAAGVTKDLKQRLDLLASSGKEYDDPGPVFDCILWNDGAKWCVCVCVNDDELVCVEGASTHTPVDLTEAPFLTEYLVDRQYASFGEDENLNYSVSVHSDGDVLSICADAGAHGTHVAGIVAAHHPDNPSHNGVAPGAQILSLKIGDSRLGSMESGVGLTRALIEAVKHGADLINMSYGEAVCIMNSGRFKELADEVVHKHGIIFVASAGNNGPALSTVGAPGGSSTALISVAAMVLPSMMTTQYSVVQNSPLSSPLQHTDGLTYTWSSVGPSTDGERGVSLMAPGGAISPVPNWTLNKGQLMNGTSMSSPNACGTIALLLSKLKAEKLAYTVPRVRRAVENACKYVDAIHPLSQGSGLIQVADAYEHFLKHTAEAFQDVRFDVEVPSAFAGPRGRGVYLRQAKETNSVTSHSVTITPGFHEDTPNKIKADFQVPLRLVSSAPEWVTCPSKLLLMHGARGFTIVIDPTNLPPSTCTCETVTAYLDAEGSDPTDNSDPLFIVPVNVVKPAAPPSPTITTAVPELRPGATHRQFITPPPGTTWVEFTIRDLRTPVPVEEKDEDGTADANALAAKVKALAAEVDRLGAAGPYADLSGGSGDVAGQLVVLHCLQLLPNTPYRDQELQQYLRVRPGSTHKLQMALEPALTLEVTMAQFWSTQGNASVEMTVDFRGVTPYPTTLSLVGNHSPVLPVTLHATLRDEEVKPSASLSRWWRQLAPNADANAIKPLGARDVLPWNEKQCYELVLEYTYECEDKGEEITVRAPLLQGILYESPYEAQLTMIYDGKKKLLGVTDSWPDAVKLPNKGAHTVRIQVRHDSLDQLTRLAKMPIWIDRAAKGGSVSVPVFTNKPDAAAAKGGGLHRFLPHGSACGMAVGEPAYDKLPKGCKQGDVLVGSVTYGKNDRPKGWRVEYVVPCAPPADPKPATPAAEAKAEGEEKTEMMKLDEAARDLRVKALATLSAGGTAKDADWAELHAMLSKDWPDHLPLAKAKLARMDREATRKDSLAEVVAAADAIIDLVDTPELAAFFGLKAVPLDDPDPAAAKLRKEKDELKEALVDALARKARAMADMEASSSQAKDGAEEAKDGAEAPPPPPADGSATFDTSLYRLQQWEDGLKTPSNAPKYGRLVVENLTRKAQIGALLDYVTKALNENPKLDAALDTELRAVKVKVLGELGWAHIAENEKTWDIINKPKAFALF
mmetsp:Transcript_61322/g.168297  ORF Transcript_61322/g.168297 Transcript_61322/m.168297 type:complete len:1350 (+) Transcript_61322:106-4155(+)